MIPRFKVPATTALFSSTLATLPRYPRGGPDLLELVIDPYRLTARVNGHDGDLPLGFVENELRNYALYQVWNLMSDA